MKSSRAGGAAAIVALAVASIAVWEGVSPKPYTDIVGVKTVCYGETRVEMRRYTLDECKDMLLATVADDFAPKVYACAPSIMHRPYIAAASVSLSYNIGTAAFCRSTAAKRFNRGDYAGGCDAFLMWNRAGGRVVKGLTNRRNAEHAMCMKGV